MPDLPDLQPYQRTLWNVLCWNFPADICRTLEDTEHIYSDELHSLYDILQSCRGKVPSHLMSKLAALSQRTAVEMVDALQALDITGSTEEFQAMRESKPYFYSPDREQLWHNVLDLFKMEYLGRHSDGSMREKVSDFHALHILHELEMEDKRCRRDEDTSIQNPAHAWYHEMSDQSVAWCLRRLAPLVAKP
ncbi:hypothetical protein VP1G_02685 [Cytospora mali]|uniref:Uncharacterized protein n=1 Tax=Cytospora mali TaxID=578113 RepID=A0A194UUE2_CYTMA|nr:hypothetical protein VP1G_02685 [Valsa mali var. pyri (nom. inval.)]